MLFDHFNVLFLHLHAFKSKIHTLVYLNLLHTNKFIPYYPADFNNGIIFPGPEPPIIKFLYG